MKMDRLVNDTLSWLSQIGLSLTRVQGGTAVVAIALLLLVLLALRLKRARARNGEAVARPLYAVVRGPKLVGYTAILLFFGGFAAWAAVAPLAISPPRSAASVRRPAKPKNHAACSTVMPRAISAVRCPW